MKNDKVLQAIIFEHRRQTENVNFISIVILPGLKAAPELRRLVAGFPPWRPRFESRSAHVGFVVEKVALGQVLSEYFGFHFHKLLHNRHHLSSEAGTIDQEWPPYHVGSASPH
jgi:hypothetical protein